MYLISLGDICIVIFAALHVVVCQKQIVSYAVSGLENARRLVCRTLLPDRPWILEGCLYTRVGLTGRGVLVCIVIRRFLRRSNLIC